MSALTTARKAQRGAVQVWLRTLRLPITAYEVVARPGEPGTAWPSVTFDSFEASVKGTLGRLLRDDKLVEQADLTRAKVDRLRMAADLEAVAEGRRAEAREDLDTRLNRNAERRAQMRESAEERAGRLRSEHDQREREIDAEAAERKRRGRRADQAVDQALRRTERSERARQLERDSAAVGARKRAARAQRDVAELDSAVATSKARRRSGTATGITDDT